MLVLVRLCVNVVLSHWFYSLSVMLLVMRLTIRRARANDYEMCLRIAREPWEWFNGAGLEAMRNNLRLYETYVAELCGMGIVSLIVLKSLCCTFWDMLECPF